MINTRTWWGWGNGAPELAPDAVLDALELPIHEGSDPLLQTPAYLATKEQIEATRLDAINDGGGYLALRRSQLEPGQGAAIGAYWRRARQLEELGPEAGPAIVAFVSGLEWTREGPRLDFYANRPRRARPAPAPDPGAIARPGPTYEAAPIASDASAEAASKAPASRFSRARFFGPTPARTPTRRVARPWPMGRDPVPLPRPSRPPIFVRPSRTAPAPAHPAPGYVLDPSASPAPAASMPPAGAQGPAEASPRRVAPMAGPDEQIAALAQFEALVAYLATLTPEAVADELFSAPELLELLEALGFVELAAAAEPTEIGASCCDDCARADAYERGGGVRVGDFWADLAQGVAQVDQQVLSPVWESVKEFVPYGAQIDQVHRARLTALERAAPEHYPARSRSGFQTRTAPTDRKEATIRDLQALARAVRRGEAAARATVAQLKERAASGEPDARRRWNAYVEIVADDDRRLAEGRA